MEKYTNIGRLIEGELYNLSGQPHGEKINSIFPANCIRVLCREGSPDKEILDIVFLEDWDNPKITLQLESHYKFKILKGLKKDLQYLLDSWNGKHNVEFLYRYISECDPQIQENIEKAIVMLEGEGKKEFSCYDATIKVKNGKIVESNTPDYWEVAEILEYHLGIGTSQWKKDSEAIRQSKIDLQL